MYQEVEQTRREFLRAGAILIGGFLVSCATSQRLTPRASTPEAPKLKQPDFESEDGRERFNKALDSLQESSIKSLLEQSVKPYYQKDYPKSVNFAGVDIKIFNPSVKLLQHERNAVRGRFTFRSIDLPSVPLYPTREFLVKVPYLGLVQDSEKELMPPQNLAADGTLLINVTFPRSTPVYEGLSPQITVWVPPSEIIVPGYANLYGVLERYVFVKEACSHLLFDLWLEEIVNKMHLLGFSPFVEVSTQTGARTNIEILGQIGVIIENRGGRFLAALDLAGNLLATKVLGEEIEPYLEQIDINYRNAYESMNEIVLGENPQAILYKSLIWAITSKEARGLYHAGNLDMIP